MNPGIVAAAASFVQPVALPGPGPARDHRKVRFQLDALYVLMNRRDDFGAEVMRFVHVLSTGPDIEPIAAPKLFDVG